MSRVIVVTGASSGVGKDITESFKAKGWTTVALGRRPEVSFSQPDVDYYSVDVSDWRNVDEVVKRIISKHSKIDLLVNNAAVFKMKSLSDLDISEVDAMIDTNLKGSIYVTKACLGALTKARGRIVNVSSVAGIHGIKNQSAYCASKHGLNGFAEALNQELLELGVSITTICPGGINTPLWDPKNNPYPGGDVNQLIPPNEITKIVEHISELPKNIVLKNVTLFPDNEWH